MPHPALSCDDGAGQVARRAVLAAAGGAVLAAAGCGADGSPAGTGTAAGSLTSPQATTTTTPPGRQAAAAPAVPSVARTDGPDIVHGPRTRHEVALTFHGQGTDALCRQVLAACAAAGAHITVFAVGTWVHNDPSLGRAFAAAGHEVGNHTWSHQPMRRLDAATAATEVARGRQALVRAGLAPSWCFRPSGTPSSTATIRRAALASGYHRCVSYDVDPADYLDPGAPAVRSRTRGAVRGGSILSLHLGHAGTAEALPGILADLSRAGLAPVTLSALLRD